MSKRKAAEIDANVEDTTEIKKQCVGIKDLVFLFFTAASCGLCQGCDLCHPRRMCTKRSQCDQNKSWHNLQTNWTGIRSNLCQFNLPVYSDA